MKSRSLERIDFIMDGNQLQVIPKRDKLVNKEGNGLSYSGRKSIAANKLPSLYGVDGGVTMGGPAGSKERVAAALMNPSDGQT